VDGLVCDLDGVVYRDDEPVPGVAEKIEQLRRAGIRIVFCTNNSTKTPAEYADKLRGFGLRAAKDDIVTSSVVTAETLVGRGLRGRRVLVVGEAGLRSALSDGGLRVLDGTDDEAADIVAVGLDRSFDYSAMRRATLALRDGALFVATNDDATFPAPGGRLWPGGGAILASLEVASGRRAEVMGKPHAPMLDAAERRLRGARAIAVVGDRPDTDLRGGTNKGWTTILVLSGVTSRAEAAAAEPRPDVVLDSLASLTL
jgi:phosphoglycolate/pyridoxal phosphate phosphatase family enzyme